LNTARTNGYNTFDIRIDKKWFKKNITWNLYFDIQNLLGAQVSRPVTLLNRPLDEKLKPTGEAKTFTDAKGLVRYETKQIQDNQGNALPSIGLQVDF
jgi:hypothetical protein